MNFFLLPKSNFKFNKNEINIVMDPNNDPYICKTLHKYINDIKKQIDENYEYWDNVKKYTNPYEFIHTVIPNYKTSISKLKPLSRSYYKMIEISNLFKLVYELKHVKNINTFHLAEGPGGFIEAIVDLRKNENDNYYGMTLINDDPNVPGWKKSKHFLEKNKNVKIEYGITETGDLLDINNLKYCKEKYGNSMEIITGDGGFDFSCDFNKQEAMASKLLFAQVSFCLCLQKINGYFILKVFDLFSKTSIDILYLLSSLYKEVYILKPFSSRLANSEKYIVCKYYKGLTDKIYNNLLLEYEKLNEPNSISSIFDFEIDYYFINKIEEFNAIFGQQQIENINQTLNLIVSKNKNDKLENLKKTNIQKSIIWCQKNNIFYNEVFTS
jgi:23S rRNA U2552 (ribose-2'-O)-methylase RlmE/FtsJ